MQRLIVLFFLYLPLFIQAQVANEDKGIVYRVFPKMERHISKLIHSIPDEKQDDISFLIDTKGIISIYDQLAYRQDHRFYELVLCEYSPNPEFKSGYSLEIRNKRYPIYFRSTDDAFSNSACKSNFSSLGGKNLIRYQRWYGLEHYIFDNRTRKFYTINTIWKLEKKLRK